MSDTISMSSRLSTSTLSRNKKIKKIEEIFRHCYKVVYDDSNHSELQFALTIAGFMMQIELGDYEPGAFKSGATAAMDRYIPNRNFHLKSNAKSVRKQMVAEYANLSGMNKPQAMLRFARICKVSSTFGIAFTRVQYRHASKTSMEAALIGFSEKKIISIDPKTKSEIQQWDLTKVTKWQGSPSGLSIKFAEYVIDSIFFAAAGEAAITLTKLATMAIQQMLSTKAKLKQAKSPSKMQSSTDDRGLDGYGFDEDAEAQPKEDTHRLSLDQLSKQSGFLSGVNRTSQERTKWFDMGSGTMQGMSAQPSEIDPDDQNDDPDDQNDNEWDLFLEDSSEDLTASAALLDTVARLGPKRTNPKWCAKKLKASRVEVRQHVLGIASKCKKVLPLAQDFVRSSTNSEEARNQLKSAVVVFTSTLPPLATSFVNVAALCTIAGKSEEILESAGDLWIGLLQFLQAMHEKDFSVLMEGVNLVSSTSATLLQHMKVLNAEDVRREEVSELAKHRAVQNEKQQHQQLLQQKKDAEAQAVAAMIEVERFAADALEKKQKGESKRLADAEEEKRREVIAEKKAKENVEKFAKAEAKRLQKEQIEQEKQRAKLEEQNRKRLAKEEKERLEREVEAEELRQSKQKFANLLNGFQPTAQQQPLGKTGTSSQTKRTGAMLRGLADATGATQQQKQQYRASVVSFLSDDELSDDEYDL